MDAARGGSAAFVAAHAPKGDRRPSAAFVAEHGLAAAAALARAASGAPRTLPRRPGASAR